MGLEEERQRREDLWDALLAQGGPTGVRAELLHELRVYRGSAGIWYDKGETEGVVEDTPGLTVALYHSGDVYPDDLSEDGVIYHYPDTGRAAAFDSNEIQATQSVAVAGLPVFVVTIAEDHRLRDVHRGRVVEWDDDMGAFLVLFGDLSPAEMEFRLHDTRKKGRRKATHVARSPRFRLSVLKRYGAQCAVCGIAEYELLDAAHICPVADEGADDPGNGLVLCALHHRVMDRGLMAFRPDDLGIATQPGRSAADLKIERTNLAHLPNRPHPDAIEWLWHAFNGDP